jgi:hypothetical protein
MERTMRGGVCGVDGLRLRLSWRRRRGAGLSVAADLSVVSSSPGGVTKWSRLIRDANIKVD